MHAAAISCYKDSFLPGNVQERDRSRNAVLFGRSGVESFYPSTTAMTGPRKQQRSINQIWDQWAAEGQEAIPPGTQIGANQMVRKLSVDARFGIPARPLRRLPTPFGYIPHAQYMPHSTHNPEIGSRMPGISTGLPDPPRSPEYWKTVAPHLNSDIFVNATNDVLRCGSVTEAKRSSTPNRLYKLKYSVTSPIKSAQSVQSHYPPDHEPAKQEASSDRCLIQGLSIEKQADEIMDLVNHSSIHRKAKLYKEAERLISLASMLGCAEADEHLARIKARGNITDTQPASTRNFLSAHHSNASSNTPSAKGTPAAVKQLPRPQTTPVGSNRGATKHR